MQGEEHTITVDLFSTPYGYAHTALALIILIPVFVYYLYKGGSKVVVFASVAVLITHTLISLLFSFYYTTTPMLEGDPISTFLMPTPYWYGMGAICIIFLIIGVLAIRKDFYRKNKRVALIGAISFSASYFLLAWSTLFPMRVTLNAFS